MEYQAPCAPLAWLPPPLVAAGLEGAAGRVGFGFGLADGAPPVRLGLGDLAPLVPLGMGDLAPSVALGLALGDVVSAPPLGRLLPDSDVPEAPESSSSPPQPVRVSASTATAAVAIDCIFRTGFLVTGKANSL
ncbi:hypothetical protein [Streptomyces sp. XD-27]|uniref:hypothetical protein n=1 Tax=Streptomyces sp. XD-27 TaxID=3062779 RepID=UPI0026F4363C|nr:hypothetical protein [Streptomyces sp. XD-27]WKX71123.1 hypothetical protein Q3Y56_15455 [Streptomyces sp. XD-27]